MPGIRPATLDEVRYIAKNLRQPDREEILALTGAPPALMLPECFRASRATWTMYGFKNQPVGHLGLQDVSDHPNIGWVWMLCTSEIEQYPFHFLNKCRELLPVIHTFHPIVTNHVDERNTTHIRWLRWMGFSFLRRIARWGAESRPFIEFARLQPSCALQQSERSSPPG